jgi:very-short-patch-repair endonuclease
MRIYNLNRQKELRRQLRRNSTPAERKLWVFLQGSKLEGRKFRRQHGVGKYVLDFYCAEERLAVELDGESHLREDQKLHDAERTLWLENLGIRVIRFSDDEVCNNLVSVLDKIKNVLITSSST